MDGGSIGSSCRALLRRRDRPRSKRAPSPGPSGSDRFTAGGVRPRAQRAEDPHRVLQGRRPARRSRANVVRFPRVHVPPATVEEEARRPVRTSSRQPATTRASGCGSKSAAGACTCVRTRPSATWRGSSILIQGWINYYGRFYRSVLIDVLSRINAYLVRSAHCKYKRLRRYPVKARRFLVDVFLRQPGLFAHCDSARAPTAGRWEPGESRGSRRLLRSRGVQLPPATRPAAVMRAGDHPLSGPGTDARSALISDEAEVACRESGRHGATASECARLESRMACDRRPESASGAGRRASREGW